MVKHTRIAHDVEALDAQYVETAGPTSLLGAGDMPAPQAQVTDATVASQVAQAKIICHACPVLCHISAGKSGACDRYANVAGALIRVDPLVILAKAAVTRAEQSTDFPVVMFADALGSRAGSENGSVFAAAPLFVTGIGASSTYPDYKPAPFIVSSLHDGAELVTVVTEAIFSYASYRVKIDTDRFVGAEQSSVRFEGEVVGHVTTAEYGSQMLSLGGVHHLTGGSKKEGRVTCDMMVALGNKQAVELNVDGGAKLTIQAGRAPIVDLVTEQRMRVGCGSATIGIFAQQWFGVVDEVIVIDDHITGVLSEHQAGRYLSMKPSGIRIRGRKSTAGRYFQVAEPGTGWGGTQLSDPLDVIESIDTALAWPGLRLLMVSTTGEHSAYFELDPQLRPVAARMPLAVQQVVERIAENCEPSLASVLFVAGAGGSLRAGATENPVLLTRAIKNALVNVTCGGAPSYIWPGGGITLMVDVARMPAHSFGAVPTPAVVAPLEFTMRLDDYRRLGGHMAYIKPLADVLREGSYHRDGAPRGYRVASHDDANRWPLSGHSMLG